ncbi:hypothetical protein AAFF_G00082420, partial [Aldrovandia affinis]
MSVQLLQHKVTEAVRDFPMYPVAPQKPVPAPRRKPEGYPSTVQNVNKPPNYAPYGLPPPVEEYDEMIV